MDLRDTTEQAAFRAELRAWLENNLPAGWAGMDRGRWASDGEKLAFLKDLQARMAADRWIGIQWPVEYGGRGAGTMEIAIYNEELARAKVPSFPTVIGTHIA